MFSAKDTLSKVDPELWRAIQAETSVRKTTSN
jgi:hypothetical protein